MQYMTQLSVSELFCNILKNKGQDSYMGCPRLFSKNHDFYNFITWSVVLQCHRALTSILFEI